MLRRGSLVVVLALSARAFAQGQEMPQEPGAGSGSGSAGEPAKPEQTGTAQPTAPDDAKPPEQPHPVEAPATPVKKTPISWGSEAPAPNPDRGFRFGSYGRVLVGADSRGGKAERLLIVAHGPRIVEPSYLELEFSYGFDKLVANNNVIVMRPIITLAFNDTLFHETGQFDAQPALRNMYLDAAVSRDLTLWAGSRMYRGDDIYLFDYWPLDDQNTLGTGIDYHTTAAWRALGGEGVGDKVEVAGHFGVNRLDHPFQFQEIDVANPVQGATTVEQLNRQRFVTSGTVTYTAMPGGSGPGAKLKLHTEFHSLPSGTRKREDGTFEPLPHDTGFLIGAEVGLFGMADPKSHFRRHLNGFVRYANGLAAFDELAPPTSFGPDLKTNRANELTFGLSGNYDMEFAQLMLGVLSRRFTDADADTADADDGWEYAFDVRPLARIVPSWYVGADISYQARFPRGLNPITLRAEDPALFQLAPMLVYSPMGPSAYDRPQLRLVYRYAHLNEAALDEYVPMDPRHDHATVHYIGVQAEWWFNSTTYR
ncbi:MAG TPA: carbohydrate porin [Kofleriaceae bacterium]|nr:carbohydrate porin [Kofleriaceae bacterium]